MASSDPLDAYILQPWSDDPTQQHTTLAGLQRALLQEQTERTQECVGFLRKAYGEIADEGVRIAVLGCVSALIQAINKQYVQEAANLVVKQFLGSTLRHIGSLAFNPEKVLALDPQDSYAGILECFFSSHTGDDIASYFTPGNPRFEDLLAVARSIPQVAQFEAQRYLIRAIFRLRRKFLKVNAANGGALIQALDSALMPQLRDIVAVSPTEARLRQALASPEGCAAVEALHPGCGLRIFEIEQFFCGAALASMETPHEFMRLEAAAGVQATPNYITASAYGLIVTYEDENKSSIVVRCPWSVHTDVRFKESVLSITWRCETTGLFNGISLCDKATFRELRAFIIAYRGPATRVIDQRPGGSGKNSRSKDVEVADARSPAVASLWDARVHAHQERARNATAAATAAFGAPPAPAAADEHLQQEHPEPAAALVPHDEEASLRVAVQADALQLNTQAGTQALMAVASAGPPKCSRSFDMRVGGAAGSGATASLPTFGAPEFAPVPALAPAAEKKKTAPAPSNATLSSSSSAAADGAHKQHGAAPSHAAQQGVAAAAAAAAPLSAAPRPFAPRAAAASTEAAPAPAPSAAKQRATSPKKSAAASHAAASKQSKKQTPAVEAPAPAAAPATQPSAASGSGRRGSLRARSSINYAEDAPSQEEAGVPPVGGKAKGAPVPGASCITPAPPATARQQDTPTMRRDIIRSMPMAVDKATEDEEDGAPFQLEPIAPSAGAAAMRKKTPAAAPAKISSQAASAPAAPAAPPSRGKFAPAAKKEQPAAAAQPAIPAASSKAAVAAASAVEPAQQASRKRKSSSGAAAADHPPASDEEHALPPAPTASAHAQQQPQRPIYGTASKFAGAVEAPASSRTGTGDKSSKFNFTTGLDAPGPAPNEAGPVSGADDDGAADEIPVETGPSAKRLKASPPAASSGKGASGGAMTAGAKFSFVPDSEDTSALSSPTAAVASTAIKGGRRGATAASSRLSSGSGGDLAAHLLRSIGKIAEFVADKPAGHRMREVGEQILERTPQLLDQQRAELRACLVQRKDTALAAIVKGMKTDAWQLAESTSVDDAQRKAMSTVTAAAEKLTARIRRTNTVAQRVESQILSTQQAMRTSLTEAQALLTELDGSRELSTTTAAITAELEQLGKKLFAEMLATPAPKKKPSSSSQALGAQKRDSYVARPAASNAYTSKIANIASLLM